MTRFSIPFICSTLTNQRIDMVERLLLILKSLDLSDIGGRDREIDMLFRADYYWGVAEGETKRYSSDGLTAINSKLGWVLSGPYKCEKQKSYIVNFTTHTMLIDFNTDENDILRERLLPDSTSVGWAKESIRCKNGSQWIVKSQNSKIRGAHPHTVICDDFLNDQVLYSKAQSQKSKDIFNSVIMNAATPAATIALPTSQ